MKNVSCEYDLFEWLKLNVASCVVHQTRSYNMVFVSKTYEMIINTQFYTNYRPRVFCFIMKDTYRSVTPLDAARVKQDDFA